jgi:adenosyl cobinamide kinase/adenosyl cobinamide phosphate guanylyltransferase
MEMPRHTGYPFDQEVVARLRERQRAREAAWGMRRASLSARSGLWGFLHRLTR